MRQIICRDDEPQWLNERRKRITASEINLFMGTAPSFYTDTREDLLTRKREGIEKQFDERAERRIHHGREREANHLRMLALMLGMPVVPFHWLVSHDRWPHLGATLDGLLFPKMTTEPNLKLTSNKLHTLEVIETLRGLDGPVLVELKNTDGGHRYKEKGGLHAGLRPWIDFSPDYHLEQVHTGLWLSDIEHGILAGSLGADDLAVWHHERDEDWALTLDLANRDAEAELGGSR